MAKKKNPNRRGNPESTAYNPKFNEPRADKPETHEAKPSFEIGVKGDEFERRYRRAAMKSSAQADRLLNSLSRESSADKYNFLGFAIPALLILIIALSLTIISRGDIEEQLNVLPSVKTVVNGEYFKNLNEVYEQTVPFENGAVKLCAALGLCEAPAEPDEEPVPDGNPTIPEPDVTPQPEVTQQTEPTAPAVTTVPPETDPPQTVQTEETEPESYETYTMYANATLNIRFGPSTDDAILGYFAQNDPVEVITIRSDGWAEILYNDTKAYAYAEYLSDSEVEVTTTRRRSRSDATTTEPEPDETVSDDDGDVTSVPEDDGGETEPTDENEQHEDETVSLDDEQPQDDGGGPTGGEPLPDGGETSPDENGEPW